MNLLDQDLEIARLSGSQRAALRHVAEVIDRRMTEVPNDLAIILRRAGCTRTMLEEAMRSLCTHARVALHFHPDRFGAKPITVAEALLKEGQYRNQFETGLSSGSRTAFPGGDRDNWERVLFGGAYHAADVTAADRPKYGALDLMRHPDGPSPRFGSCYFVLQGAVSRRTSFTFAGSELTLASERLGSIDKMDCVMAALLAEVASGGVAQIAWPPNLAPTLGAKDMAVSGLLEHLCRDLRTPYPDPSIPVAGRVLDSFIEAQVHGPIDLRHDVERLVIDPSFEKTQTGDLLKRLSCRYDFPLYSHCGFQMAVRDVPDNFRGPAIPRVAQHIAGNESLDAAIIGAAESSLHRKYGPTGVLVTRYYST